MEIPDASLSQIRRTGASRRDIPRSDQAPVRLPKAKADIARARRDIRDAATCAVGVDGEGGCVSHAPTPWKVDVVKHDNGAAVYWIVDVDGDPVAHCYDEEDASFIIECENGSAQS